MYFQKRKEMDFSNVLNSTYTLVLLALLVVSFISLSLYYGLIWLRVGRYKKTKLPTIDQVKPSDLPSVSVVVVAHNEAEALKKSLPYLLEQDYPDYEVVVVDYTSQDDTPFVLRVCSENYPNLKPVNFPADVNMFKGKKYPLSIGIKSATKDVVLLTEPDCIPKGFDWIKEMMCGYMHGASMVMGYRLLNEEKTILNAFQQYENLAYNASYLGMSLMGNPYTASGSNLSYRRDFFFAKGGFISHYSFPDGADDLFVNQNATKSNSVAVLREGAAVYSDGCPTFGLWHQERLHRKSSRRFYGLKDKLTLAVYPLSQCVFLAALLWLWIGGLFPWQLLAGLLAVKIIWQIVCSVLLAKRFKVKKVQFLSPFFELYFLFANTILFFSTLRKKNIQWR